MKHNALFLILFLVWNACSNSSEEKVAKQAIAKSAIANIPILTENEREEAQHKWDGFYFYNLYMGMIIVIHNGKYYNFERKEFQSFYKDFEYDIDFTLNKDGFIPIVRKYSLNRKEEIVSKETVLFDTQPVEESGEVIAMKCRGKQYQRLPNFGAYIKQISASKANLIKAVKANSKYQEDALIEKALLDPDFIKKSKMTEAPLRKQDLAFWQLVVNIIEAG